MPRLTWISPRELAEHESNGTYPTVSDDPDVQGHYESLRRNGQEHTFATVAVSRCAPTTRGLDRSFVQGRNGYDDGLNDSRIREKYYAAARKAGISTSGKFYVHGLADYQCDPKAWVSDLGEVKAKCVAANKSCEGAVNYQAPEGKPQRGVRLAEHIVQEKMQIALAKDPGKATDLRGLREEVIERHGQKKKVIHNTIIE